MANLQSGSSSTVSWSSWNLKINVGFCGGRKPEDPEKNPRGRDENQQQTQPTYGDNSGNRTRATLVGGECYHHCGIPANPCLHFVAPIKKQLPSANEISASKFSFIRSKELGDSTSAILKLRDSSCNGEGRTIFKPNRSVLLLSSACGYSQDR